MRCISNDHLAVLHIILSKQIRTLLLLLAAVPLHAYAQKEASHWVFGGFGGVDFTCATPQLVGTPFNGLEGGACISSASGELLMITNGDVVWDRDFHRMPNGMGLGGLCTGYGNNSSATQSALIVPHPGNADRYYIFTTDCAEDGFSAGLRYSVVDMSQNGGKGDVIEKDKSLATNTAEKVAAVFQANGKDVWVVTHGLQNNEFYAFSITASGLNTTPVVSAAGQVHWGGRGYMKFSPDGRRLAATSFLYGGLDGIPLELFTFDKTTGKLAADFVLPTGTASVYSLSFSPNGKILYASSAWTAPWIGEPQSIDQYNLEAGTPQQIVAQRYRVTDFGVNGAVQLGIDGRLYCLIFNAEFNNYLSVIANPDRVGTACAYTAEYIPLPCNIGPSWGLPNFIESYFETPVALSGVCEPVHTDLIDVFDFKATSDCANNEIWVENLSTLIDIGVQVRPVYSWMFDFGDGQNYSSMFVTGLSHTYDKPGTYLVTLTASPIYSYLPCFTRTMTVPVTVGTPISPDFRAVQDCGSLRVDFTNETQPTQPLTWQWSFGDNGPDNSSTARSPSHRYARPGRYTVTLVAKGKCGMLTRELPVTLREPLSMSISSDTLICEKDAVRLKVTDSVTGDFLWSDGSADPYLDVREPGKYWLALTVDNCVLSDTVSVAYCIDCEAFIPNVITPNDDDKNDDFFVNLACHYVSFRLDIYNRWGTRVHTTDEPHWDGRVGNEAVPAGVYFYVVHYSIPGARARQKKKGWISVLK